MQREAFEERRVKDDGRLRLPDFHRGDPSLRLDEPCPKWQLHFFGANYVPEEHEAAAAEDTRLVEEELVRSSWTR